MSRSGRQAAIGLGIIAAVLVAIAAVSNNANRTQGLRADVLSTRRAEPGDEVGIAISTRDTEGVLVELEVDFGDGTPPRGEAPALPCARPFTRTDDFRHTYARAGTYTVRAVVRTARCGAQPEQVEAIRTIQVKPLRR